jgi:asparagine synthase (glutamine-hydrolysing)
MTMAASVEARAPFLDHHLVEFAARLPLSLHWSNGSGKRTLKRAFRGVVPDSVLMRKKQGFGAPVWRWSSSLREIAERELLREPIFEHLNEQGLRRLLDEPSRRGWELWVVLNFALWHRHWIEGDDLRDDPSFTPPRVGLKTASAVT